MTTHRRTVLFVSTLLAAILSATLLPASTAAAAPVPPRLRLRMPADHVELFRSPRSGHVSLELPVYLAAHDAPFELRVRRAGYDDPVTISQALYDGATMSLLDLPPDVLVGWRGLVDFFRVRVYATDGRLLRVATANVCPSGWDAQRVDDSGPFAPTYPTGCDAGPFTLGAVWGIDAGWAVQPGWLGRTRVRLAEGRYRAVVSITVPYRELFGIPREDAMAETEIRVTGDRCAFCGPRAPAQQRDKQRRLTAAPIDTDPDPGTIVDLVALPAFAIEIGRNRGRDYLRFAANVWNRGPASLVVEGFRAEGEDRMEAFQYFLDDGTIVGRAPVGEFDFDRRDGHDHWHFLQFARYRLLDASQQHVVRSRKQSFCLAPTDAIDLTVDGAVWRTDGFGWSQCGWESSLWIREVLPTGWGDTYFQYVPGQSFNITEVPNGTYFVQVIANPQGLLFDADPTNDAEVREVVLGGTPGHRTVEVLPWHGIDV